MPNLYKQYLVQNQQNNTRVINPNAVLEERMAKILERQRAEQRHQEELAKSFEAGIVRGDTEIIEEIVEVDPVEEAKEEAERILAEAKVNADMILKRAQEESVILKEEARMSGYKEGEALRLAELSEEQQRMEAEFTTRRAELERTYTEKHEHMEEELVNVIIEVFNKVFHIQFENKKHILMHLINDAILNIEGDKKFRIKVADSNVLFLENHREDILERVGHSVELEFIADSTMDGNDCLIETDSGVFDCSLGTQLESLIKDIKSLCS